MGQFKIEIIAVGGHGQDREVKEGGTVDFRKSGVTTPDAIAKQTVETLQATGVIIECAKIVHWPGSEGEVTDNLVSGERKGNF